MMNQNQTNTFNPEIIEYFLQAGYQHREPTGVQGGLLFVKETENQHDTVCVQFWHDKIEVRKGFNYQMHKSYKGFNGQDVFQLMWLMHLMDAINLQDVRKMAGGKFELKMAV